jgi:minor curlin subunit
MYIVAIQPQSAQSSEETILRSLENSSALSGDELQSEGNTSAINQYGAHNTGLINQFQQEYGLGGNYANILQDGTFNDAILYQYGNDISTSLIQLGNANYARVILEGTNIDANLLQDGNGNYIDQNLSGSNFDYSVVQDGNNNLLIQQQTGLNSTGFQINQVGDGITTIIIDP